MAMSQASGKDPGAPPGGVERRRSPADRRNEQEDRRNSDRQVEELIPRRDPDRRGRRSTD